MFFSCCIIISIRSISPFNAIWSDILTCRIALREQYIEVTQKAYDVATRHQMLMDAMGLNTPVTEQ